MSLEFALSLRGYHRTVVDDLVDRAQTAIASGTPDERAKVTADMERGVPLALRGYDRLQVDAAFRRFVVKLATTPS
jgi:hypothetical protein